jgi:hypothetical protein
VSNYKIRVKIEIVESEEAISVAPEQVSGGLFEFNIAADLAESIDDCEQALLATHYPALRAALSEHLETVSKKKPKTSRGGKE